MQTLTAVYRDPGQARQSFERLAEEQGTVQAVSVLRDDPGSLGRVHGGRLLSPAPIPNGPRPSAARLRCRSRPLFC